MAKAIGHKESHYCSCGRDVRAPLLIEAEFLTVLPPPQRNSDSAGLNQFSLNDPRKNLSNLPKTF